MRTPRPMRSPSLANEIIEFVLYHESLMKKVFSWIRDIILDDDLVVHNIVNVMIFLAHFMG